MIATLKSLRGNVRGCVYTEALWGIPYNLYAPFVSVYMLALGLNDAQIGLITSLALVCQVVWALTSGAITDKFGRRRTTLVADLISWSIPCLIWAFSRNFNDFLLAAVFNSVWRVSQNSWMCLLVEDADPALLVPVFSWIYIAGLVAAFAAPFSGLLMARFSLVPTMRGLFLLALVMMTIKFVVMNAMTTETQRGMIRRQETRGQNLFALMAGTPEVVKQILRTPAILHAVGLMLVVSIARMVSGTFWSILVTEKLLISDQYLAYLFSARSIVQLLIFFLVMPRLQRLGTHRPMLVGFAGLLVSQVVLISIPAASLPLLAVATLLEALCIPAASALLDQLVVLVVDAKERARIMAIVYVMVIVCTSPFGWIAGEISQVNRNLPFVLNIVLYFIGGLLIVALSRRKGTRLFRPGAQIYAD